MLPTNQTREQVIDLMRRLGMQDRIPEAQSILPDPVDLKRDADKLAKLGLSFDMIVDQLGGSAW
jgi:hypothetical protein